jgi:hypothetical protein
MAAHVTGGGGLLDARRASARRNQHIDDRGHPEHRGMQQGRAARDATCVRRRVRLEIGSRFDEDLRDRRVAIAGRGDQLRLGIAGLAVDRRAGLDQRARQIAGARHIAPDPARCVIPEHRHIPQRRRPLGVIAPMFHRQDRQLRFLAQQRAQPRRVAAVEDLAAQHLGLQLRPAREPVLARHGKLRRREHQLIRDRANASQRISVGGPGGAQQILGLATKLAEVGSGGKIGHDVS